MIVLNLITGPLIEAWGEVKVQKTRVILSLVGVVAAVAALSVVMALGDLIVQSQKEIIESIAGRQVTLHFTPEKSVDDEELSSDDRPTLEDEFVERYSGFGPEASVENESAEESQAALLAAERGLINDPVGSAMKKVVQRFDIPYWSRKTVGSIDFKELETIQATGTYEGKAVEEPLLGYQPAQLSAVDPGYSTIFRLRLLEGRWLEEGDETPRMTPIVVNEILWKQFGSPSLSGKPWVLTSNEEAAKSFRVVGVIKAASGWDPPEIFLPYEAWQVIKPSSAQSGAELLVWTGEDQAEQARTILPNALASVLGEGWTVPESKGLGGLDSSEESLGAFRTITGVIGGIVIFLGALGLLNVAIVTVRQRIREIGIRRAMGASGMRIFFSVFMESVVATFVAGVLGVGLGAVILRNISLDSLGITLQEVPGFPMSAAVIGLMIAVSVGALCGIVPALAAVRVKPIDAIRS